MLVHALDKDSFFFAVIAAIAGAFTPQVLSKGDR
jgi:hypothetical protein